MSTKAKILRAILVSTAIFALLGLGRWLFWKPEISGPVAPPSPAPGKVSVLHFQEIQPPAMQPRAEAAPAPSPQPQQTVTSDQYYFKRQTFDLRQSDYDVILAKEKAAAGSAAGVNPDEDDQLLKDILVRGGVEFPAGSSFAYDGSKIYAVVPPESLAKIPAVILSALNRPFSPPKPFP